MFFKCYSSSNIPEFVFLWFVQRVALVLKPSCWVYMNYNVKAFLSWRFTFTVSGVRWEESLHGVCSVGLGWHKSECWRQKIGINQSWAEICRDLSAQWTCVHSAFHSGAKYLVKTPSFSSARKEWQVILKVSEGWQSETLCSEATYGEARGEVACPQLQGDQHDCVLNHGAGRYLRTAMHAGFI